MENIELKGKVAGSWWVGIGIVAVSLVIFPQLFYQTLSHTMNLAILILSSASLFVLARGRAGKILLTDSAVLYYSCSLCVADPPTLFWKDILSMEYNDVLSGRDKNRYYRFYLVKDNNQEIRFYKKYDSREISEDTDWVFTDLAGHEGIHLSGESCESIIQAVHSYSSLRPERNSHLV